MPAHPKLTLLNLIDETPAEEFKKEMYNLVAEGVAAQSATTIQVVPIGLVPAPIGLLPAGIIDFFNVGVVSEPHPDLIRRVIGSEGVANRELGRVDREARKRGLTERNKISHEAADRLTEKIHKAKRVYLESIPKHEIVSRLAKKFDKHPSTIRRHLKKTLTR
jgi:hypothetical protein